MKRVTLPLSTEAMALIDIAVRAARFEAEGDVAICRDVEGARAELPGSEGFASGQRMVTLEGLVSLFQREGAQMYVSFLVSDDEVKGGEKMATSDDGVARAGFNISTSNGTIYVTVAVDMERIARDLYRRAQRSKSGTATAIGRAVIVNAPRTR